MIVKTIIISIILFVLFITLKDALKPQKKRSTNKYL